MLPHTEIKRVLGAIHPKSGACFSVSKNLRKKCKNLDGNILRISSKSQEFCVKEVFFENIICLKFVIEDLRNSWKQLGRNYCIRPANSANLVVFACSANRTSGTPAFWMYAWSVDQSIELSDWVKTDEVKAQLYKFISVASHRPRSYCPFGPHQKQVTESWN